jgi:small-conductance mechanosensitive channel
MTRDRIAGIGFQHPDRNARPLTKRKLAVAHLLMTAVLVICIVIAVTAVAIGSARADTFSLLAQGREGIVPLAVLIGILLAGLGGVTAAIVRRP